ncbi:hypothetical protein T4D_14922 [Trichinella pseudospiralis]|uniref:Uncharacterized protein n=1 Tax=Trichinella pseudospiralis TaxID=6337 RepID=A0A0V1FFK9_TRIPS|nr:hypothetical protein T4D_14922 [Trichinella pseudospiralis]
MLNVGHVVELRIILKDQIARKFVNKTGWDHNIVNADHSLISYAINAIRNENAHKAFMNQNEKVMKSLLLGSIIIKLVPIIGFKEWSVAFQELLENMVDKLSNKSMSENSFSSFSLGNIHIVASFVRSFNANISNQVTNYTYALYMYICMICNSYSYSIWISVWEIISGFIIHLNSTSLLHGYFCRIHVIQMRCAIYIQAFNYILLVHSANIGEICKHKF